MGTLEPSANSLIWRTKACSTNWKVAALNTPVEIDAPAAAPTGPSQEELDAAVADCGRLREALEQAAERQRIADEMASDLRKRLKVAQQEVDDLQSITEQVQLVQTAIQERDATLERQRDNIRRLKEQIDRMNDSSAVAERRHAERERELLDEIAELKAAAPVSDAAVAAVADEPIDYAAAEEKPKPRKRKARRRETVEETDVAPKITDDDLVDVEAGFAGHDWFGAPDPAELERAAAAQADAPDDFGYHAPEPKPRPYDDGMQMSLFD